MESNNIFLRIHLFFRNMYIGKEKSTELDEMIEDKEAGKDIEENNSFISYPKQVLIASNKIYEDDGLVLGTTSTDKFIDLEYGYSLDEFNKEEQENEPCKCKYCFISKKVCFVKSLKCINTKRETISAFNNSFIYV